jgi:regulator of protease activity HflC (stomatin/prohibitin superfamily)
VAKKAQAPPTWGERLWGWYTAFSFYIYTTLVLMLLLIGVLWTRVFITVPPGHHGVMYRQFGAGTVTDRIWGEGLHVIPPWDRLTLYESRLQQQDLKINILSDEGLNIGVRVSVRFRPEHDMLGYLHQDIGPEYYERLIRPEVEAHVRQTFGNRPAHEIHSSAKDVIQELRKVPMITRLERDGGPQNGYIYIQELKLVDVDLPEIVQAAIAEKYRQEQLMLEYRHKIVREDQEAERKRIEAKGIRDYNAIAGELSSDILRWRDIEATLELAKSPSSKVIMLGGGGGSQMPLVFSLGADAPAPATKDEVQAPPPAEAATAPAP